ncbi:hypothetical protein BDW72DRAFT_164261 [Aspergillus terricola var. indicus]
MKGVSRTVWGVDTPLLGLAAASGGDAAGKEPLLRLRREKSVLTRQSLCRGLFKLCRRWRSVVFLRTAAGLVIAAGLVPVSKRIAEIVMLKVYRGVPSGLNANLSLRERLGPGAGGFNL